ncbi:MAG: hypothetical protein Q8P41_05705 [Pseudomonadota bacterium]|nr:hypothetical protein [Pseudomonadota bacterium]
MRLLPVLALLAGCYDGATTTVSLDLKAGTAHVVQQLHNAWPDEVDCAVAEGVVPTVEACVEGVRKQLDEARAELVTNGAVVHAAGIVLAEGELDLYYEYDTAVGAKTLTEQGLSFVYLEDRSKRQVERGRPGKKHVAMVSIPITTGTQTTTVDGRYRLLTAALGEDTMSLHVFRGKTAAVTSEWVYGEADESVQSPGAWLRERPGLEDALRASGLVVPPKAAPAN